MSHFHGLPVLSRTAGPGNRDGWRIIEKRKSKEKKRKIKMKEKIDEERTKEKHGKEYSQSAKFSEHHNP